MKQKTINRILSLLLALVCAVGLLPLSAFAAGLSSAPGSITQKSSDYMKINGKSVRYKAASSAINSVGLPYVFDEQVTVPGYGDVRALCAYQKGTLGPAANGQKWNYKEEVDNASLRVLLTYIYSFTYNDFTAAGDAAGLGSWTQYWSDIWFLVAQAGSWLYEHGTILDVNSNREGFIEQMAEEFVAAMKLYHDTYGQSSWSKDWDKIGTHSIIDSSDGGKTGNSAYDYIATGVNLVLDHPEYFHNYHLWIYDWDKSQPWKLAGQSGVPMQRLLIAVPEDGPIDETLQLTVKKLEAGTNKPLSGVTFSVKSADGSGDFSVTRTTGADGTLTLTDADGLTAGQFLITEEAVPEGYIAQTESQLVTVLPNNSAANTFTFYNATTSTDGDGSIRKVNADDPTEGIPGAVIRITSVKLDDGGSFFGEYITGDGGYISKEDLDFSMLPTGSFIAEEITPPEGFILSSDVSKVKQPFVWDGKTDVSLVFENSAKVKVQLKNNRKTVWIDAKQGKDITVTFANSTRPGVRLLKLDGQTGKPIAGAVFKIEEVDGGFTDQRQTGPDGIIFWEGLRPGAFKIFEVTPAPNYVHDDTVHIVQLEPNHTTTIELTNIIKPTLKIQKVDSITGNPLQGAKFQIWRASGETTAGDYYDLGVYHSNEAGEIVLEHTDPGWFKISELESPSGYSIKQADHEFYLAAGQTKTVTVENIPLSALVVWKYDSVTGQPVEGAVFQVKYLSGASGTGGTVIGTYKTSANGSFTVTRLQAGAYVVEVRP